jgi:hypothetical protein
MKHTPWFPANVKPVRAGVYEIQDDGPPAWYRRWDGKDWYVGDATPKRAAQEAVVLASYLRAPWRGLAEEPK